MGARSPFGPYMTSLPRNTQSTR